MRRVTARPSGVGADPLVGTRLGHYRIGAVLGRGGMGTVYRARDAKLHRPVALKFVQSGRSRRTLDQFLSEVRTVSGLNDPNIVTIHGFENYDNHLFIVMELVEGLTLRVLSDGSDEGPVSIEEIVRIAIQVASALHVAHAAGVVHRDIKPENVMVRQHDRLVKLLDFGLARLMPRAVPRSVAGRAGEASGRRSREVGDPSRSSQIRNRWYGTLRYMSPEQIEGRRLSSATDIFSLGVVLYELLTKSHPFGARDQLGTLAQILERKPRSLHAP